MPKLTVDRIADLRDRTAQLIELREHPSWAELRVILEERKQLRFHQMQRQLMAGVPVDQRYIDRQAGFFAGAEWILDNPDMAENSLNAALKKAALMGLLEGDEIE